MSVSEVKTAIENGNVVFGLKQTLKNAKKIKQVFVVKDARDCVLKTLDDNKIVYKALKNKKEMEKLLGLDFACEVFSIK